MNENSPLPQNLSKESLQTALMLLLKNKALHEISITELCQRAGVSRMAYYRHYDSILALYQEIINELLSQMIKDSQSYLINGRWYDFWLALFQSLLNHKENVQTLLRTSQQIQVLNYLNRLFIPQNCGLAIEAQLKIKGIIGLTFNIMIAWIDADFQPGPDHLAQICNDVIDADASTFDTHYLFSLGTIDI